MQAMKEEMSSLQKNHIYELVPLPRDRRALKNKWVYKLKKDGNGKLLQHKARLVVKGLGRRKELILMRSSPQL